VLTARNRRAPQLTLEAKMFKIHYVLVALFSVVLSVYLTLKLVQEEYGPPIPFVYDKVLNSVVRLSVPRVGSGTGFYIAANDRTLIITNGHVCDLSLTNTLVVIPNEYASKTIYANIIEKSDAYDLCALELVDKPYNDIMAIKLAETWKYSEHIYTAGYPQTNYLTVVDGYVTGITEFSFAYPFKISKDCVGKKFMLITQIGVMNDNGSLEEVCYLRGDMLTTTANSAPGSSGSPAINSDLQVIGVVMAAYGNNSYAGIIPVEYLHDFLDSLKL